MNTVYTDQEQAEYEAGYNDGRTGNIYSSLQGRAGFSSPYGHGFYDSYIDLAKGLDALAKYHNSSLLVDAAEFLRQSAAKI